MIYLTANKYSGSYSEKKLNGLADQLSSAFGECSLNFTVKIGGRTGIGLDPESVHKGDTIIAAGGDGTINACLQYIHDNGLQDKVKLGIVPMGTGNNMIKSLGLKKKFTEAVRILKDGNTQQVSYGTVNDDRVFFNCSIGFAPFVLKNRKTNSLAGYFMDVARLLPKYKGIKITDSGGETLDIFAGFFINTKAYMSKFRFLKNNNCGNELKFFYIRKGNLISNMANGLKTFLNPENYLTRTEKVYNITLPEGVDIELDGDIYCINSADRTVSIKNRSQVNVITNNKIEARS
jgi:diacylglycerol kinase family enzyme